MFKAKPKRTLALPLVALSIFLPVLAACGGSDDSSGGSGAAAGGGSSAAAGGGTAGKGNDQYVKFAQCMRQNGVPQWPDPVDGTKFRMPHRGAVDPNSPQVKAAGRKCRPLAPPGWDGSSRQDPANQAQMLKYAQCMRKNGVPTFPDPQGGSLDIGDNNPDSPQFKAAAQKCKSLQPTGGGG
ncbi:hypothetical protein [Actinomadura rudentiformis]|uniref:Lipoprotein n=1 Tax=Actinomadura rudentiformis TaxID=359158 RepID=A0A6H9YS83_9ACTN|nr:hypothetical protein [Actinomadura rudentiformis]KAB2350866.1 hypothetical protein F8566_07855 [Actinomadura rudentiformis]